ncbi:transporter [Methylophaga sp. 42_25_T18]|nr:transporter [Methylophaga sp. 42_25_T18]OUR88032.1 transporter [Methylophaga sp. 42_8_T64]
MSEQQNNPLHGFTLEQIINKLVEHYGWEQLGQRVKINCFTLDPSVKSSLKFLRKTPWARKKVEDLFVLTTKNNKYTP